MWLGWSFRFFGAKQAFARNLNLKYCSFRVGNGNAVLQGPSSSTRDHEKASQSSTATRTVLLIAADGMCYCILARKVSYESGRWQPLHQRNGLQHRAVNYYNTVLIIAPSLPLCAYCLLPTSAGENTLSG
jgi:hypothetical protein